MKFWLVLAVLTRTRGTEQDIMAVDVVQGTFPEEKDAVGVATMHWQREMPGYAMAFIQAYEITDAACGAIRVIDAAQHDHRD